MSPLVGPTQSERLQAAIKSCPGRSYSVVALSESFARRPSPTPHAVDYEVGILHRTLQYSLRCLNFGASRRLGAILTGEFKKEGSVGLPGNEDFVLAKDRSLAAALGIEASSLVIILFRSPPS